MGLIRDSGNIEFRVDYMKSKTTQILLTAVMIGLQYGVAASNNTILNPYENVNWDTFGRHRANLHSHTTESDGHHTPR